MTDYGLAYESFRIAQENMQLIPVESYGEPSISFFTRAAYSYLFDPKMREECSIPEAIMRFKRVVISAIEHDRKWVKTKPRLRLLAPFYEFKINGEGFCLVEDPQGRYTLICDGELKVIEESKQRYYRENLCPCMPHY